MWYDYFWMFLTSLIMKNTSQEAEQKYLKTIILAQRTTDRFGVKEVVVSEENKCFLEEQEKRWLEGISKVRKTPDSRVQTCKLQLGMVSWDFCSRRAS